eukprot:10839096-Heterocapsa_arctica.AAC.1
MTKVPPQPLEPPQPTQVPHHSTPKVYNPRTSHTPTSRAAAPREDPNHALRTARSTTRTKR